MRPESVQGQINGSIEEESQDVVIVKNNIAKPTVDLATLSPEELARRMVRPYGGTESWRDIPCQELARRMVRSFGAADLSSMPSTEYDFNDRPA